MVRNTTDQDIRKVFAQFGLESQDKRDRFGQMAGFQKPQPQRVIYMSYLSNNSRPERGAADAELERTPE